VGERLVVPDNFPQPVFTFGQEVYLKESDNEHGIIIGMRITSFKYVPHSWEYAFYQSHIGSKDNWYDEDQLSVDP